MAPGWTPGDERAACGLVGLYQDKLIGLTWHELSVGEAYRAAAEAGEDFGAWSQRPAVLTLYTMPLGEAGAQWTQLWSRTGAEDVSYSYSAPCYGQYFVASDGPELFAVDVLTGEETHFWTAAGERAAQEAVIGDMLLYLDISEAAGADGGPTYEQCALNLSTGAYYRLGEANGEGNPFAAAGGYLIQEAVQYISPEDYYHGAWDRWISLA